MRWIFCAGMIRAGSTLQYQIASSIIEKANLGKRHSYASEDIFYKIATAQNTRRIKSNLREPIDVMLERYEFMTFKAHKCHDDFQRLMHEQEAMAVYCYRDIRDVANSFMKKYNVSFQFVLEHLENAINNYYYWKHLPNVYMSKYENFTTNIFDEVKNISSFLKINLSNDALNEIADNHTIEKQKMIMQEVKNSNPELSQSEIKYDEFSLIHHNHIQDDRIVLTPEEYDQLTEKYCYWLYDHKYLL